MSAPVICRAGRQLACSPRGCADALERSAREPAPTPRHRPSILLCVSTSPRVVLLTLGRGDGEPVARALSNAGAIVEHGPAALREASGVVIAGEGHLSDGLGALAEAAARSEEHTSAL